MPPENGNPPHWSARIGRLTALLEDALLVLMLTVMIAVAVLQILLRNYFDLGLVWGDSLLRAMVLWVGLLGAIVASRNENHISIDILSRFMPPRVQALANIITDLFTVAVCAVVSYYSYRFVELDFEAGVTTFGKLPAWVIEAILPVGFAIIALRYCVAMGRKIRVLQGRAG